MASSMSMMALMLRLVQMCELVLTDTKIGNFMVLGYGGEPPLTFICSRDVHIQSYNITNYGRILSHNRGSLYSHLLVSTVRFDGAGYTSCSCRSRAGLITK